MSSKQPRVKSHKRRVAEVLATVIVLLVAVTTICYETVPTGNTEAQHFDVLLVLGTPALRDGTVSRAGDWLVREAAQEYEAGKAGHVVMSGGAVANRHVEADALARHAQELGVPATAILEDRAARNTQENVDNTEALMKQHGWKSAEVIGLKEHLPRTGVLLEHTSLQWRTHAAATPGRGWKNKLRNTVEEALGTTILRTFGIWTVPVLHRLKMAMSLRSAPGSLPKVI